MISEKISINYLFKKICFRFNNIVKQANRKKNINFTYSYELLFKVNFQGITEEKNSHINKPVRVQYWFNISHVHSCVPKK